MRPAALFILALSASVAAADTATRTVYEKAPPADRRATLHLRAGGTVEGVLTHGAEGSFILKTDAGERRFKNDDVAAVSWEIGASAPASGNGAMSRAALIPPAGWRELLTVSGIGTRQSQVFDLTTTPTRVVFQARGTQPMVCDVFLIDPNFPQIPIMLGHLEQPGTQSVPIVVSPGRYVVAVTSTNCVYDLSLQQATP